MKVVGVLHCHNGLKTFPRGGTLLSSTSLFYNYSNLKHGIFKLAQILIKFPWKQKSACRIQSCRGVITSALDKFWDYNYNFVFLFG